MICPRCQSENPPNAAFCDECGARLETACPNCGESNRRTAKFCRNCGQAINQTATPALTQTIGTPAPETYVPKHLAEKIRASRHAFEGERKQITVLFADIRGSTKLLEHQDPEEAQKIIDPVLHVMMDAVHRYEGTVNQVLGDGIMALFGAPLAHEDHALRACYTALAMQGDMCRHREKLGQSEEAGPHIGIGLNTGEVVVRSIDTDLNVDYSALGHTTHLAARMQEMSHAGGTLLTAATLREVEGFIQVKALGAAQVKGISKPVEVYELIGATSARTRVQAGAARGLTPLVGRTTEIDIFNKLVQRATGARGQILAMVGEPGVGKSRLVHEFTRHQLPPGWLVLEGTSVSYGKATPYFPLIEMLRHYFQIGDGESSDNTRTQIMMHLLKLDSALKDAIPPILSLLGLLLDENTAAERDHDWPTGLQDIGDMIRRFNTMDPQQRRRYILDAVKRICISESRRQNLLLVFEDLHWIDHETQAFLEGLVDSLPMSRILLIVNYRPGYTHGWGDKSYYTQLRVEPLQSQGAEELLNHLLGKNRDLAALKELLIKRTDGNPFFAEETVRSLVEKEILVGERGAYRPGIKIDGIAMPSTVQNVVADRIDRLPIEEKHLLQTAAVIGMIVPFGLLRAVTELRDEELYHCLAHLQSAEFLYETNLFPELEYSFKHALTNEVAYGELLNDRRTAIHALIVKALEEFSGITTHDHVEKLAHHAFLAELWDKAVTYLKNAGDAAVSRSSFRNAVLDFERALKALRHLPKSSDSLRRGIDLRFDIRNALFVLNDFKRGFEYLEEAKEAANAINDQERLGKLYAWMTAYWNLAGNSGQAVITGLQALEHTVGPKNIESNIVTHYFLGLAYHNLGEFQLSIDELAKARSLVTTEDRKYDLLGTTGIVSVLCKAWLIRSLAQIGNFSETYQLGEQAIQTALERDHPFSIVYAYYAVGTVALIKGDFNEAIAALEHGLSACETAEIPVQRPLVVSCLAAAYASVGRFDEALRILKSTTDRNTWMTGASSQQLPFGKAMRMVWEVEAYKLAGEYSEAEALARRVLEVSIESKDRGSEAWLRRLLGDLLSCLHPSDSVQAETSYREALTLAQDLKMRPLQAHCYLGLGQFHAQSKNDSLARSELHAASELYQAMSMPFWIAKTHLALAAVD